MAFTSRVATLDNGRGADRLWIDEGTANYFSTLGLRPLLGRTFLPGDDDGVLAHPNLVLTYKAWQARFGGDSSVIGRVVRINDHPMTVIGVTPPEFHGVLPLVDIDGVVALNQLWPANPQVLEDRRVFSMNVVGRLRAGVSREQARRAVVLDVLASILYGVKPHDPLVLGGVAGLLTAIAILACFAPARRATRIDPITALRAE
jgi:MacB-like protein